MQFTTHETNDLCTAINSLTKLHHKTQVPFTHIQVFLKNEILFSPFSKNTHPLQSFLHVHTKMRLEINDRIPFRTCVMLEIYDV